MNNCWCSAGLYFLWTIMCATSHDYRRQHTHTANTTPHTTPQPHFTHSQSPTNSTSRSFSFFHSPSKKKARSSSVLQTSDSQLLLKPRSSGASSSECVLAAFCHLHLHTSSLPAPTSEFLISVYSCEEYFLNCWLSIVFPLNLKYFPCLPIITSL